MKFTLSWLKDHLETSASIAEVADDLPANFPVDLASTICDGLKQAADTLGHA